MKTLFVMSKPSVDTAAWEAVELEVSFSKLCDFVVSKVKNPENMRTMCSSLKRFLTTGIKPQRHYSEERVHKECSADSCSFCNKEAKSLRGWNDFNSFLEKSALRVGMEEGELNAIVVNGDLVFDMFSKEEKKGFKGKGLVFSDDYGREQIA